MELVVYDIVLPFLLQLFVIHFEGVEQGWEFAIISDQGVILLDFSQIEQLELVVFQSVLYSFDALLDLVDGLLWVFLVFVVPFDAVQTRDVCYADSLFEGFALLGFVDLEWAHGINDQRLSEFFLFI